jgi:excisionase family DNA binding protein
MRQSVKEEGKKGVPDETVREFIERLVKDRGPDTAIATLLGSSRPPPEGSQLRGDGRLALSPSELAESLGVGRSRIFQAIKDGELQARKAGSRTTIIDVAEGLRWFRSLPTRGRKSEKPETAVAA